MKSKEIVYDGYIEGYYGRLFNWSDRHRIIDKLNSNKMNSMIKFKKRFKIDI